jgi:hypothetical protein
MNKDRRKQLTAVLELLREIEPKLDDAKRITEEAKDAEQEYFDKMSENLQGGDKGQQAQTAVDNLDEVQRAIDDFDVADLITKVEEAAT